MNPDGKEQVCLPADPSIRLSLSAEIDFPPEPDSGFHLSDGVGLQAFVLVGSRQPLPAYQEGRTGLRAIPWSHADAPDESVWHFDGASFTAESPPGKRGDIRPLSAGDRAILEDYLPRLKDWPGIEAIQALAFAVKAGTERSPKP